MLLVYLDDLTLSVEMEVSELICRSSVYPAMGIVEKHSKVIWAFWLCLAASQRAVDYSDAHSHKRI